MVLKFLNFAQQVALIKKPVKTFSILAFQTDICEWLESYVKNQLGAKMEGPFLFLVLLVRNILQVLSQNFCHGTYKISINILPLTIQIKLKLIEALGLIFQCDKKPNRQTDKLLLLLHGYANKRRSTHRALQRKKARGMALGNLKSPCFILSRG